MSKARFSYGFYFVQSFVLAFMCCIFSISGWTATTSGEIKGEETWSGTIKLTGDVKVTESGKLTIQPGTRIECAANTDDKVGGIDTKKIELIVDWGTLSAKGMEANPIVFTSAATTPSKGDWYGLRIKGDQTNLRYCTVEYSSTGVAVEGGIPTIDHCTFQKSSVTGITFGVTGTLTACTSGDNGTYGVYSNAGITLTNCMIRDNSGFGVEGQYVIVTDTTIQGNGKNYLQIISSIWITIYTDIPKDEKSICGYPLLDCYIG